MPRYFIKLAYKGTNYHGWQRQENAHSIQAEVDAALEKMLGQSIETLGCGRTDAGVHAREFYAHFDINEPIADTKFLVYKLNKILPAAIVVYSVFEVTSGANARFDALSRTYHYVISRSKNPFELETAYYLYGLLDIGKMNAASKLLFNHVDFTSFSKSNTQVFSNNCKIYKAEWYQKGDLVIFEIKANRFLRNMVRAIVGTLLQVGRGELSSEDFDAIILAKDRSAAGFSVPAEGLFLTQIEYPDSIFL